MPGIISKCGYSACESNVISTAPVRFVCVCVCACFKVEPEVVLQQFYSLMNGLLEHPDKALHSGAGRVHCFITYTFYFHLTQCWASFLCKCKINQGKGSLTLH